jgi:Holliday junction resolvase RusA-like endonuclease
MKKSKIKQEKYTYETNPKIDILIGTAGFQIPTKQDKFAPVQLYQINKDGSEEEVLSSLYSKKPNSDSVQKFHDYIKNMATEKYKTWKKVMKPNVVEVVISVSATEKRFKEVDVDNLAKCVLDCLNGIAFEDDSQVVTLICNKHIHEKNLNGILIAITTLTNERKGILGDLVLFNMKTI